MSSTFVLPLEVEREVGIAGRRLERAEFFAWLWRELASYGLLGIHEGTLLSENAAEQGLETDSWTVDAGEAPRERDWVSGQTVVEAELYFGEKKAAESAARKLDSLPGVKVGPAREQPERDWDAEWKAAFLSRARGLVIPPGWHILPPWASDEEGAVKAGERVIRINPGAGFGTGTHETTQLCLTALHEVACRLGEPITQALDFGSGSGILAIAAAVLGARKVAAVEIDPLAIENAMENARLNGAGRVRFSRELTAEVTDCQLIVANILRPVLLEFREELAKRLDSERGSLVLSGLIEQDVEAVRRAYTPLLGRDCEVRALGEWRCLVWLGTV